MSEIIRVKTITHAHEIFGLDKPKHPLVSVIHHKDMDLGQDFGGVRYAVDLYQVSLKEGMSGSLGYGRNSYDFQEGTMIFTSPGQVLMAEEKEYNDELKGWSLIFHPDLIRKSPLGKTIDNYSFFSYDVSEALHLSDDEKKTLNELVEKIKDEYNQNIDKHSQKLIVANIELLLDYCNRYYDRQFYTRSNMHKDSVTKFEQLLKDYYNSDKPYELGVPTVNYCGTELGMSPNYLSDLLKQETGRNAIDHIHTFIIDKAKTILLSSANTVSEIAYDLGFEYPQYFSKLFKNKTGVSPGEYRNLN